MTDFQSRINQFRQGLNDQQDNYNKLAANMSQMGRSVLPDKVAEHMEYVEKIGGSLTGAFAGAHATSKLYKKIKKARDARNARNQNRQAPQEDNEPESQATRQGRKAADTSEGQAQGEQADRTIQQTDTTREQEEDPFKEAEDPTELGPRDITGQQARGGKLGEAAKDMDDEENPLDQISNEEAESLFRPVGGGGGGAKGKGRVPDEDPAPASLEEGAQETETAVSRAATAARTLGGPSHSLLADVSGGGGGSSASIVAPPKGTKLPLGKGVDDEPDLFQSLVNPKPADIGPSPIKVETAQGGNINPKTDTPSRPTATADATEPPKADLPDVIADKEATDDVGGGILKRAGSYIGKKVAGAIGEDAAAGLAEGVPILGEMVGLGMLIHGIVKAHRHEENSGGPQLTAPNKEATEQSGGFSTDMLKSSIGAPTIV